MLEVTSFTGSCYSSCPLHLSSDVWRRKDPFHLVLELLNSIIWLPTKLLCKQIVLAFVILLIMSYSITVYVCVRVTCELLNRCVCVCVLLMCVCVCVCELLNRCVCVCV